MRRFFLAAACLLCVMVFCVRGWFAAHATSPTFDEAVHLTAGYSYWRTGDFRMNRETPPLMKLVWALPLLATDHPPFQPDPHQWEENDIWRMGDAFLYDTSGPYADRLIPARMVNVFVGAALVALVGWWAQRLWGRAAGVTAWALAALDPNLLGQSAVLSTDVGLALFCTAAAYALWEYAANPRPRWFYLAGVCLGLALATKFSGVVAVAGCGVGALVFVRTGGTLAVPGTTDAVTDRFGKLVSGFVRLGLVAVLTILPAYFLVQSLDWARGLRLQLGRNEFEPPHYYLNGEVSSRGWWWYFTEVIGLKTPVGTLALAVVSSATLWLQPRLSRREVALLVVPMVVYFLAMSAAGIDIGIRVVLPAYPLVWLTAARAAALDFRSMICGGAVAIAVIVPTMTDHDWLGERSLSYMNGMVAGRSDGLRYLGDSNLDWGQGLKALKAELAARGDPVVYLSYAGTARPEAVGIRYQRLPGWGEFRDPPADRVDPSGRVLVAISVSNLQGTYLRDPATYRWLLDREPLSRTDDSIWVFDLTGDREALERLQQLGTPRDLP
jgi:hypothetical protein